LGRRIIGPVGGPRPSAGRPLAARTHRLICGDTLEPDTVARPDGRRRHHHRRWRWNRCHQGPATKEEKVLREIWTEQQRTFENDRRELLDYLEDPDATEREEALKDVAKLTKCLKIVQLARGSRSVLRSLKDVSDSIANENG
jgi:hypothetical protein